MKNVSQKQLRKLAISLAEKAKEAQILYENSRKLYVGLYGEEPQATIQEPEKSGSSAEPRKRLSREDYEPHVVTFLKTAGAAHYQDIHKALVGKMDASITESGVYKSLHRLAESGKSEIIKGERRGFFTLRVSGGTPITPASNAA